MGIKDMIKDRTKMDYMTSDEIATLLHMTTPAHVRRLLKRAGVPVIRAGYKKLLYRREDVNRFLKEREV